MKFAVWMLLFIFTGILFPACSPCRDDTPKAEIMRWVVSDEPPATNVKMLSKQIPCAFRVNPKEYAHRREEYGDIQNYLPAMSLCVRS